MEELWHGTGVLDREYENQSPKLRENDMKRERDLVAGRNSGVHSDMPTLRASMYIYVHV